MTIRKLFSNLSYTIGYIFLTVLTVRNVMELYSSTSPVPYYMLKAISIICWTVSTTYFVIILSINVKDYLNDQLWYMKLKTKINDFLDTKVW